jgi:hypothetical protein
MQSKNAPCRVVAAQRRQQAVQLRAEGATYKQIASEVGISYQRAHQLVGQAMAEVRADTVADAAALRDRELAKLDALEAGIWTKAAAGDLRAIETVLKLMSRRAKLLGLDAPKAVKVEAGNSVAHLSDAELLAEAARLGIDVTPFAQLVEVQMIAGPAQAAPAGLSQIN